MPELRAALAAAGFAGARTYVGSGNVVLDSELPPAELAQSTERLIAERFGLEIRAVVRTRDELEAAIARDPFPQRAVPDKLYHVTFLSDTPPSALVDAVAAQATEAERFAAHGREWYALLAGGSARSKLALKMAAKHPGIVTTARNWTTITALQAMASNA